MTGPCRSPLAEGFWKSTPFLVTLLLLSIVPLPIAGAQPRPFGAPGPSSYTLPRSALNITDHNLSFETNEVALNTSINGSWELNITGSLVANASRSVTEDESEISFGPGPIAGDDDEDLITPIFIVQEAASGLLRIEYVPFPMNDTYGFVVYLGFPVPAGAEAFDGHTLSMVFDATAPPMAAYPTTVPYAQTNGNVSVAFDGATLVPRFAVDWSNFSAFYAYGLTTDGFVAGSMTATVTALPTVYAISASGTSGTIGSVPTWVVSAAIAAVVAGAAVAVVQRRRARGP
jgi:hypothetical protein